MKTTEQFEAWWKSAYADSYDKSTVGYVLAKSIAWSSWQESRGAVDIAIPDRIANINLRSPLEVEDMWRDRMDSAIRAAGIKVKE